MVVVAQGISRWLAVAMFWVATAAWMQRTTASDPSAQLPPTVMHFCAANCATLRWLDGHFVVTTRNPWEPADFQSIWSVERFGPDEVILHRHDSPNRTNPKGVNGWDVTYRGQVAADGNHLTNVTEGGVPSSIQLSWGAALEATPGDNAERDRRKLQSASTTPPEKIDPSGSHPPGSLPAVMRFCGPAHCGTLTLHGQRYDAVYDDTTIGATASTYTVEHWDSNGVLIRREDAGVGHAVLTGRLSPQGDSVVDGVIVYTNRDGKATTNTYQLSWATATSPAPAASATSPGPRESLPLPDIIHYCEGNCWTLRLHNGFYNRDDGMETWTVERFTDTSAVLHRHNVQARWSGGSEDVVYAGDVADERLIVRTIDGKPAQSQVFGWGAALTTVAGNNGDRDALRSSAQSNYLDAQVQAVLEAPPPTGVALPAGAASTFRQLPADLRAILSAARDVSVTLLELPCADKRQVDATEALEIGRFAYRAADYPRGHCWIERSAALGSVRATELLGLSAFLGWGVAKDPEAGIGYLHKAAQLNDPWGVYFLEQCYLYGGGTPIDREKASRLDQWLMAREEGRAIFMTIGADDAEQHDRFNRMQKALTPPPREKIRDCRTIDGHQSCTEVD